MEPRIRRRLRRRRHRRRGASAAAARTAHAAGAEYASTHSGRQNFLLAEDLLPVEVGDRRPAQDADLFGDLERACLELRRVQVFGAESSLSAAVLDIGRVMFGKKLDLTRGPFEAVMFLEGGEQHLANE